MTRVIRVYKTVLSFICGSATIAVLNIVTPQPIGQDAYFHLAIARDYSEYPLSYSPNITEGVLAKHNVDREPLFHSSWSGSTWWAVERS